MSISIEVSSSDWVDLRTRGFSGTMYLLNAVGAPLEYSIAASPVAGAYLTGFVGVVIPGPYLWVRGAGTAELFTPSEWVAYNTKTYPVTASSSGPEIKVFAGDQDITNQIGGGASDGAAGTGLTYTARNLDHATVTRILLPSAPAELLLNWWDSTGSSGNLCYVLEAASLADATARLNDDTAHGELVANGNPVIVKFEPTMFPVSIYVRASSAVGAGSNILSLLAKVTQ